MQWASFLIGYIASIITMLIGSLMWASYVWHKLRLNTENIEREVDIETMFLTPGGSIIRRVPDEPEVEKPKPAFSEQEIERLIRGHVDG